MRILSTFIAMLIAGLMLGCGAPAGGNVNTNANTALNNNSNLNININTNAVGNTETNQATGTTIDTKEPDSYQATVTLKFETLGDQKITLPQPLQANVARKGDDRRMEFTLPNNEKLIYLDKGGRQFVISPNRKQYAELTQEALGFEVRRMMMPGEIVNQVKNQRGVQQVGEEQINGRAVIKYRYGATANTGTQAGQVNTESFVYVDKETGLPLRSETVSQSQGGNVQGITGVRIGTEMSNISTDVDPSLFNEPTDFQKVQPEQVRQQVNLLFSAAVAIAQQMMRSAQTTPSAPANTNANTNANTRP
jgi:outer membrane lipoprotein-sorting protein